MTRPTHWFSLARPDTTAACGAVGPKVSTANRDWVTCPACKPLTERKA